MIQTNILNKLKEIKKFECMREMAELKALSNYSLQNVPIDEQYKRMMELKDKLLYNEVD